MQGPLLTCCLAVLSLVLISTTPGCRSDSTSGNPNYNINDTTSSHQGAKDNNSPSGTKPGSEVNTDQKDNH